jgi:mRNA interferase MazF
MSAEARRGEVWQSDLGMVAKVRPCLLLTDAPRDDELALVTVVHHTTSTKGNRWELEIKKGFLKEGAFHFQQINTIQTVRLMRRLGSLTSEEMERVKAILCDRLGC